MAQAFTEQFRKCGHIELRMLGRLVEVLVDAASEPEIGEFEI